MAYSEAALVCALLANEGLLVLIDRQSVSLHRPWIVLTAAGAAGAAVWYALAARGADRWPGGSSPVGLALGAAAGAIILVEFLLWPRKKLRAWRLGRMQIWLRAHIWLGLLCGPLALLHSGFQWGGLLSTTLAVLLALVIVSGVFGLVVQQIVPRMMLEQTPAETIYSQIEHVAGQLLAEARELVAAACEGSAGDSPSPLAPAANMVAAIRSVGSVQGRVRQAALPAAPLADPAPLRNAFADVIEPFLREGARAHSALRHPLQAGAYFDRLKSRVEPAAHLVVDTLADLCTQRRQFILQARLQAWLHGWLWVHLPLSVALVLLLVAHVFFAVKYW